jgi:hypothetical protein
MSSIFFSMAAIAWIALLIVSCVLSPFAAAHAESPIVIVGGSASQFQSFFDDPPDAKAAAFYRAHSRPARGLPSRSAAGSWFLETDRRTELAYPRLVAVANGMSVARANKTLEAIHGRVIQWALEWSREGQWATSGRVTDPGVQLGTKVAPAYFSSRYFGVREMGLAWMGGTMHLVVVRTVAVDIERGSMLMSGACPRDQTRPFFTFGNLLTVCTESKLETFQALWREHGQLLQANVPEQKPELERCRYAATAYIEVGDTSLYLTNQGLAVHNTFATGVDDKYCFLLDRSPFTPVIILWHKLAALMNPGPLRDELLALQ